MSDVCNVYLFHVCFLPFIAEMEILINLGLTPLTHTSTKLSRKLTKLSQDDLIVQLKKHKGLKAWDDEIEMTEQEFLPLLVHMIEKPKLNIYAQVYFDTFSLISYEFPLILYLFGYGHMMEQNLLDDYAIYKHFKHQTVLQPFLDSPCEFLPTLKHDPQIMFKYEADFVYKYRQKRTLTTDFTDTQSEMFHYCLSTSNLFIRQHRWFESYAYSLKALDYVVAPTCKFSVLCNLAISLSQLSVSSEMTWFALEKAIYCQNYCQHFEWMVACLQVLISFGLFEEEKRVFGYCKDIIPKSSAWYEALLQHHLRGLVHQFENNLARCVVEYHTINYKLFEIEDISFFNQVLKQINVYAVKLVSPGAKEYYQALGYIFKSLIKKNDILKNVQLDHAKRLLNLAIKALDPKDPRYLDSLHLSSFLQNEIQNMFDVCDEWRQFTSSYWSTCSSEFWLKCALIHMINERTCPNGFQPTWLTSADMANQAKEDYIHATFKTGYRVLILTALNKLDSGRYSSQQRFDFFRDTRKFKMVRETNSDLNVTSEMFVHFNVKTEQAYIVGYNMSKTPD
jgi:hypothetical protein